MTSRRTLARVGGRAGGNGKSILAGSISPLSPPHRHRKRLSTMEMPVPYSMAALSITLMVREIAVVSGMAAPEGAA